MKYQAVDLTYWRDQKVRAWSHDGRTLAIYLLTCASRSSEGFYALPVPLALDELRWDRERLETAAQELASSDFAHYDLDTEAVFVAKGLKYNAPAGPTRIKGAVKLLDRVHGSPELFERFLAAADHYAPSFAAAIRTRYGIDGVSMRC